MPYLVCFSAALFFAYELVQMYMMNAIAPLLMKDLNITGAAFGKLCATYLLADVIFLLPAGIILDRYSTRKVILTALLFCIIGTTGFAFVYDLPTACICHFFSGIGNAFCFLSCMMLISRWFPPERQAFIVGMVITVGMLGGVIAQSPFSLLAEFFSWRQALLFDALFGLVVFGLIFLFVHDGPISRLRVQYPFWQGVRMSIFNLQNICCGLYTSFMNMPLMVLGAVWGSMFLTQIHNIPLTRSSFIVSMICMGTIIGSPVYGYFSDNSGQRRPWMIIGGFLSLSTMLLIMFVPHPSESTLITLFFLLGFFSSAQILGYPLITEHNPKELTGTSMGIAAVIIMGLPALLQPLSGILLDLGWNGVMKHGTPFYSIQSYLTSFSIFPIGFLIALAATSFIKEKMVSKSFVQ